MHGPSAVDGMRVSRGSGGAVSGGATGESELLLDILTPIVKAWGSEYALKANDLAIQDLHEKNRRLAQAYEELQAAQDTLVRGATQNQVRIDQLLGRASERALEQVRRQSSAGGVRRDIPDIGDVRSSRRAGQDPGNAPANRPGKHRS